MIKKLLLFFTLFFLTSSVFAQNEFVTLWRPSNPAYYYHQGNILSTNTQIFFPGEGTNYNIYWEEVGFPSHNGTLNNITSTLGNPILIDFGTHLNPNPLQATYQLKVSNGSGNFSKIAFQKLGMSGDMNTVGDTGKILDVIQWGNINFNQLNFSTCSYFNCTATDAPTFLPGTDLRYLFSGCNDLTASPAINTWNTSNVINMSCAFQTCGVFNQPLSNWDTSNVTDMRFMFFGNYKFNQDISMWNTSKVTNMQAMFEGASKFSYDIGNWGTGNVTDMSYMFYEADSFNHSLNNWNTSKVATMEMMFFGNKIFNADIGNWDTSSVTNMSKMFWQAIKFNKPIGNWNTSKVTNMESMFLGALQFNQPINNWNTSKVTNMQAMFGQAFSFNQPLGNWDTSNVVNFDIMFYQAIEFNQNISTWNTGNGKYFNLIFGNAVTFNQNLGNWDLKNLTQAQDMLFHSGLNCENYDATLIGWASQPNLQNNINLGDVTPLVYSSNPAVAARSVLVNNKGWTILGETYDPNCNILASDETSVQSLKIYPNPVVDLINFSEEIIGFDIYDMTGKLIRKSIQKGKIFDVSFLLKGEYIFYITDKNYRIHKLRVLKN